MKTFWIALAVIISAFFFLLRWGATHQPKYICPAGSAYSGKLGLCIAGATKPTYQPSN